MASSSSSRCPTCTQIVILLILGGLLAAFLGAFATLSVQWTSWEQATCLSEGVGCFCETIDPETDTVRQDVNAWSNIAFLVVGLAMTVHACGVTKRTEGSCKHEQSSLTIHPMTRALGVAFGICVMVVGIASFLYHASVALVFQYLENASTLLIAAFMLAYVWYRLFRISALKSLLVFLSIVISANTLAILVPSARKYVFLVITGLSILFETYYLITHLRKDGRTPKRMFCLYPIAVLVFAFGVVFAAFATYGVNCDPSSLFQFHALWHVFKALFYGLMYMYYVAENDRVNADEGDSNSVGTFDLEPRAAGVLALAEANEKPGPRSPRTQFYGKEEEFEEIDV